MIPIYYLRFPNFKVLYRKKLRRTVHPLIFPITINLKVFFRILRKMRLIFNPHPLYPFKSILIRPLRRLTSHQISSHNILIFLLNHRISPIFNMRIRVDINNIEVLLILLMILYLNRREIKI